MEYSISHLKFPIQTHLTIQCDFISSGYKLEPLTSSIDIAVGLVHCPWLRATGNRISSRALTFWGFSYTYLVSFVEHYVHRRSNQILVKPKHWATTFSHFPGVSYPSRFWTLAKGISIFMTCLVIEKPSWLAGYTFVVIIVK